MTMLNTGLRLTELLRPLIFLNTGSLAGLELAPEFRKKVKEMKDQFVSAAVRKMPLAFPDTWR